MSGRKRKEYLIEFISMGHTIKVCAVDPITKREVSIVGPATATEEELKRTAVRKLEYVLKKELGEGDDNNGEDRDNGRRGLLI